MGGFASGLIGQVKEYWHFVSRKTDQEVTIQRPLFFIQAFSLALALPMVDAIALVVWKWGFWFWIQTVSLTTLFFSPLIFLEILWSFTPRDWRNNAR